MPATNETNRPADIPLPAGWTWEDVEAARARWDIGPNMVPVALAGGVVAWGTINSVRIERAEREKRDAAPRPHPSA